MLRSALVLGLLVACAPARAADTIHRCQAGDGTMVYTDKPCDELDARPIAAPEPAPAATAGESAIERRAPGSRMNQGGAVSLGGSSRDDCIRRTDTLLFEIHAAVESRNVNRLAGVYDWAGKSAGAAGDILERLSAIADRPLAAVEFYYPEPVFDDDPYALPMAQPEPEHAADERPAGVRIVQQAPGEDEPSFEARLRLTRNAGCWWVSF